MVYASRRVRELPVQPVKGTGVWSFLTIGDVVPTQPVPPAAAQGERAAAPGAGGGGAGCGSG